MNRPIEEALGELVKERGALVSSADCSRLEIVYAQSERRFFVDANGLGYVLRPQRWRETAEKCVVLPHEVIR